MCVDHDQRLKNNIIILIARDSLSHRDSLLEGGRERNSDDKTINKLMGILFKRT